MGWMSRLTKVAGAALDAVEHLAKETEYHHPVSQEELNAYVGRNLPAGIKSAALTIQEGCLLVDALIARGGVQANARMKLAVEKCRLDDEEQSLELRLLSDPQIAARGMLGKLMLPLIKTYVSTFHHKSLLLWRLEGVDGVTADGSRITVDLAHFGGRGLLAKALKDVAGRWGNDSGEAGFFSSLTSGAAEALSTKLSIVSARCKTGVVELKCQYAGQ